MLLKLCVYGSWVACPFTVIQTKVFDSEVEDDADDELVVSFFSVVDTRSTRIIG